MRLLPGIALLAATATAALGTEFPVQDGERLSYRVAWAIIPGAGEIKVAADVAPGQGGSQLVVTSTTATRSLARMLLPFDATAKSVFDLQTGRLLSLQETSTQRGRKTEHRVTFDYVNRQATYTGGKSGPEPRPIKVPEGNPSDLIMALLQTRTWNLPPGGKQDALVLFNDDFYELTIYRTRTERVETPLGRFDAMVLEPRMEKTPPKGMFRRGSTVRVWIAEDTRRLPVKFEVEFKIGKGTATLEAYQPPPIRPAQPAHAPHPRP